MKRTSYILEVLGWSLILFTLGWSIIGGISWSDIAQRADNPLLEFARHIFSLLGFILEGLILGVIAIILAKIARSPEAPALGELLRRTLGTVRKTGQDKS